MFGLLALANAWPQYGYNNYFSGSKKPLGGSYSSCKVEWRSVKKAGYKEVTEYKDKTVYEMSANTFMKLNANTLRFLMTITKLNVRMVMTTNVKSNGFV